MSKAAQLYTQPTDGTNSAVSDDAPPTYTPVYSHVNIVSDAARIRAVDEQEMQQRLLALQYKYQIYNSDIEPEHEADWPCNCAIHQYNRKKWNRNDVQVMWSKAVMYPGEKLYTDNPYSSPLTSGNPYRTRIASPYGYVRLMRNPGKPSASNHAKSITQTITLNNILNKEAQAKIDAKEPYDIWAHDTIDSAMSSLSVSTGNTDASNGTSKPATSTRSLSLSTAKSKPSRLASFRKSIGMKPPELKAIEKATNLRSAILSEESSRWPDSQYRSIVTTYQATVGMTLTIAHLRNHSPIQYLHLLRAGYFEPIPVAWANSASNPLKFAIEAKAGWRGITPTWRGYEDTAEERLYWVLNHREATDGTSGTTRTLIKPDFISAMDMARSRMAKAVDPPPAYFDDNDTCHVQHTSDGYSKQVMPPPFRAWDREESSADETMILLDVSGSMDFEPGRPVYDQYLITRFVHSLQPKNKDVAKAIIRRFTDAMSNHSPTYSHTGISLTTFSDRATHIGQITHSNLSSTFAHHVTFGGGTRVMTGWQKIKDLHFTRHSESAVHHPVFGWLAGPDTPMLRLLLLLDGEATDMDEFELDLLGCTWAHVTIFLIGVDGCPHHHRHANELARISEVNHHVSFVDAQGNCPERFVTHELLKRHLGREVGREEFEVLERLPEYEA